MTMNDPTTFENLRSHLETIAYNLLGSVVEAQDIVQEAYIKWLDVDQRDVQSPRAYLTSIVTRLSINRLKSAQKRREQYRGTWLPEPYMTDPAGGADQQLQLADSLSMAFILMLQELNPIERAVFLLRIAFDYEYTEIASIVDKSEATCRQIVSRARKHLNMPQRRQPVDQHDFDELLQTFSTACREGDMDTLLTLLHEDIVMYADSGGLTTAPRKPVAGADRVARFTIGAIKKLVPRDITSRHQSINGLPGLVTYHQHQPRSVMSFDIENGRIRAIYLVTNPEKLGHLPAWERRLASSDQGLASSEGMKTD